MTTSLRSRVVEAGARARYELVQRRYPGFVPLMWEEVRSRRPDLYEEAHACLDAMLDCLSENADEWADVADELDEIEWPPKGMTLERAERMRSNTHLWFLAVLRNPE